MLNIATLNQSYGQSHTFLDVDVEVPTGAFVSLIGMNCVGITTLLNCVMGLLSVDTGGIITYDGIDLLSEQHE